MGVNKLLQVIFALSPGAVRTIPVSALAGPVSIDMSIVVYQMVSAGLANNIVNDRGEPINHILGVFHRMIALRAAGITPIAVFDGPPPELKRAALSLRKTRAAKSVWAEVRELLALMGIAAVTAPGEAEAMAARGGTFATEDMDAVVFAMWAEPGMSGVAELGLDPATNPTHIVSRLGVGQTALVIDVPAARGALTREQFVDMCAMLGTDYNRGLRGVGPKRAPELMLAHGSAAAVLRHLYPRGVPANIDADLNAAGVAATYAHEAVQAQAAPDTPAAPERDLPALANWLRAHGVSEKTIAAGIARM